VPAGQALVISANLGGSLLFSVPLSNTGGGFFLGIGNTVLPPVLGPTSRPSFTFNGLGPNSNSMGLGGGAIFNLGIASISNSRFENNTTGTGAFYGGAIANTGTAIITNSSFSGNTAAFAGGAIASFDAIAITNSSFSGNTAGLFGGAVRNFDTATITNSSFSGNAAGSDGGAIENARTVTITNSNFSGNTAGSVLLPGFGGAFENDAGATATITNSSFSGNTASLGGGGAIVNLGAATITIINSSFENNSTGSVGMPGLGGAFANDAGAAATITNSSFSGNTANMGGAIFNFGTATITDGAISANAAGNNGGAVFGAAGSTTTLNAMRSNIAVTGNTAGGLGGAIYLDGAILNVNGIGGDITFSGNTQNGAPNAIYMTNEPGSGATATFNAGAGHAIEFLDPIESNGAEGLVRIIVNKSGSGFVSFDGSEHENQNDSKIYANTTVEGGTFEVAHGAVYGETEADALGTDGASTFSTTPASILQGGVSGTVRVDAFTLESGSTLDIAGRTTPGSPFSTFTISGGTATFQPGSEIKFNTFLGADNSPTDKLVISGAAASGDPSLLLIENVGGTGAGTTANGILLVKAVNGGTTAPGTFALPPGVRFRPGAVDYRLFRGGLTGSDPAVANDWFLRSSFIGPDGSLNPIIGPELATYGVVQPIARQMAVTMLGTLHERIGDTLTLENADPYAEGWGRSGWARFFGQQIDNQYKAFAEPSTTGRLFGVQAGFDIFRGSIISGHRDAAGLYFAYGNSEMDVDGLVTNAAATGYVRSRTGTVNLYGYSGGAYWTHYGPGGWYVDGVVQGTAYTGNAATEFADLPTNGSGIITSLEVGYPIPLAVLPRFIVEPQGQLLWQHTSFGSANDGLGSVGLGSTSGASGRLGLRAQSTILMPNGMVWQPYARANLWQNWGGAATTTFGTTGVPLLQQSTQLEFAAGVTTKVSNLLSFYAQAGYEFAVGGDTDGGRRQGVKGDIGLRLTLGHSAPPPPGPVAAPAPAAARSYLVFFDWDKATLTDRARQIIREAAENSTRVQYTRIDVNGHTDTTGGAAYNQRLSVRRAEAVAAELIRNGVPRGTIAIRGFGQTGLLVPTGPGVREPENRRVEIIIR